MNLKSLAALVMVVCLGLIGCSGNNRSGVNDLTRPIGYYSNENHSNRTSSFFNDNDGPIVEYLDHTFGTEGKTIQNQKNINIEQTSTKNHPSAPPMPLIAHDQTSENQGQGMMTRNGNDAGLLQGKKVNKSQTNSKSLGILSDQIRVKAANVKNVYDVRSAVLDSSVLLSVHLKDKSQAKKTKVEIQNAIKPLTAGKSVTIITDEGKISRKQIIKDEVRDGGGR